MIQESPKAENEDFNLSTDKSTTVLELAEAIWKKMKPGVSFKFECEDPYKYDVQRRVPSTEKARTMLGFQANTLLDKILEEVIPWIEEQVRIGGI